MRFKHLCVFLFTIPFLVSCDSSTTNPDTGTNTTFTIQAVNSNGLPKVKNSSFTIIDEAGTQFIIEEAKVNVRHIQFHFLNSEYKEEDRNTFSITGPFVIDLLTGNSEPEIGSFEIRPGIFRRIDVRLDDSKSADAILSPTDHLLDNTLVVKGTFNYAHQENRNFRFILKFNEDVRFENPDGIELLENTAHDIILLLKVSEWFEEIDLTTCLDNGDIVLEDNGDLIIDDVNGNGKCGEMESTLKRNIKRKYDLSKKAP